jgi:hypothetical protein
MAEAPLSTSLPLPLSTQQFNDIHGVFFGEPFLFALNILQEHR